VSDRGDAHVPDARGGDPVADGRRGFRLAHELGCRFCINTDAHSPGQLDWQINGCERAAECGIAEDAIVNAWDAPKLLAWSASHERAS